ncbi:MAG: hypothetical protein IPI01_18425 [Ignavibacteriae bacterium]|nr:hypothetical protein [Ignavibacteriota bacterium]
MVMTDFVTRSNGTQTNLWETWSADLSGEEWVYFGDPGLRRSLFLAHHESDAAMDHYHNFNDSMTVFGFGRSNDPLEAEMNTGPQHFTLGS